MTGAAGDAIQAVAVNYLQGLAASQVKEIVSALGKGPQAEAARAAMHTIVGSMAGRLQPVPLARIAG